MLCITYIKNKSSLALFFLHLLPLLDSTLEEIQIFLQLAALFSDRAQHLDYALVLPVLTVLANDGEEEAPDAEDYLPELSLPLAVFVELALQLSLKMDILLVEGIDFLFERFYL